jgi:pyruvate formate lyase activating enzyme
MKALIFNIQRYSIHDGEGIRTVVFFKGCPLHCPWCSNPESQSFDVEKVMIESKCTHCKAVCPMNPDECPSGAVEIFGKEYTIDEVMNEVLKDSIFYSTSGGGVTLSGGEVLGQAPFATELLKRLKRLGIDTAIETSGMGSTVLLKQMAEHLDTILFDLKIMDPEKAKSALGADINLIKANLETLVKMGKHVIPRIPLIPGYTMDDENIKRIVEFVKSLGLKEVHILPFHQYGSGKYEFLKREYALKGVKQLNEGDVEHIRKYIEGQGLKVVVGGL